MIIAEVVILVRYISFHYILRITVLKVETWKSYIEYHTVTWSVLMIVQLYAILSCYFLNYLKNDKHSNGI